MCVMFYKFLYKNKILIHVFKNEVTNSKSSD
jgi:hypothetical protein